MKVKTIEVCNATNMDGRNIFGMRNLSRLLLASLTKSTLPKGESKRGGVLLGSNSRHTQSLKSRKATKELYFAPQSYIAIAVIFARRQDVLQP